jgi:uracil-DNA glycosylase family 4
MKGKLINQDWQKLEQDIIECRICPRLVGWREEIARIKRKAYREQEYWGKPVPGFGDHHARVLIVGLAPGAHGSNRTGRMFTGDASGVFLYSSLFRARFANQGISMSRDDGLLLNDFFISALCRCAPPSNKPTLQEILNCRLFLKMEIELLNELQGFVALGRLAFDNILKMYKDKYFVSPGKEIKFRHGALYEFENTLPWLLTSYHPSQQNTQTGKLTTKMFDSIWVTVRKLLT